MKKILLYFILSLLFFSFGSGFGFFIAKNRETINRKDIYSECWRKARNQLIKTCKPSTNIKNNFPETNFYGKIIGLDAVNNKVIIDPAPLSDGNDKISSLPLILNNNTKIEKIIKKTDAEYKKELEEFNREKLKNKNLKYPLQFTKVSVGFDDFLVGQKITVFSTEDIRNKDEVGVSQITINYQ